MATLSTKSIFVTSLPTFTRGWNGELFFFDHKDKTLKQMRIIKMRYKIFDNTCNVEKNITIETAECDGTIRKRVFEGYLSDISKNFYCSVKDYQNGQHIKYDTKDGNGQKVIINIDIKDILNKVIPFECIIKQIYCDTFSIFRYSAKGNEIKPTFFEIPTTYIYTPTLGWQPDEEIICPPNTYATTDECRDSIKVNVCYFGKKMESENAPKTINIIAVNGFMTKVSEDTYEKIKKLLGN